MKSAKIIDIRLAVKRRRFKFIKQCSLSCCYVCVFVIVIGFLSYSYMNGVQADKISASILPKY